MRGRTILTKAELCAELKVGASTIDRLRAEGLIRHFKIRTQVRFVLEEVIADLRIAERQLPLRRINGTLHLSGGPRKPHFKEAPKPTRRGAIVLEDEEVDDDL